MRLRWRPLAPGEHDTEKTAVVTIPLIIATGVAWLLFALPLPSCTFKAITGYPCAGCGATRATHALAHGEPIRALLLNPLTIMGYVALGITFLYATYAVTRRGKMRLRFDPMTRREKLAVRLGLVGLILGNWLWVLCTLPESPWCAR